MSFMKPSSRRGIMGMRKTQRFGGSSCMEGFETAPPVVALAIALSDLQGVCRSR